MGLNIVHISRIKAERAEVAQRAKGGSGTGIDECE